MSADWRKEAREALEIQDHASGCKYMRQCRDYNKGFIGDPGTPAEDCDCEWQSLRRSLDALDAAEGLLRDSLGWLRDSAEHDFGAEALVDRIRAHLAAAPPPPDDEWTDGPCGGCGQAIRLRVQAPAVVRQLDLHNPDGSRHVCAPPVAPGRLSAEEREGLHWLLSIVAMSGFGDKPRTADAIATLRKLLQEGR